MSDQSGPLTALPEFGGTITMPPRPSEGSIANPEDTAHQARSHREEMRSVLPLDAADIDQFQVDAWMEAAGLLRSTIAGPS